MTAITAMMMTVVIRAIFGTAKNSSAIMPKSSKTFKTMMNAISSFSIIFTIDPPRLSMCE